VGFILFYEQCRVAVGKQNQVFTAHPARAPLRCFSFAPVALTTLILVTFRTHGSISCKKSELQLLIVRRFRD
jgi:hypothetical protein